MVEIRVYGIPGPKVQSAMWVGESWWSRAVTLANGAMT